MLDPTAAAQITETFQAHHAALVRLATSWLGDAEAAEDCVQDVWLTVLPRWRTFRGEASRWTWLYRVTRNRALSLLRCSSRETDFQRRLCQQPGDPLYEACWSDPFLIQALESALDTLPTEKRRTFLEHVVAGRPLAELARDHGVHPGTCRSQFFKARAVLREKLGPIVDAVA